PTKFGEENTIPKSDEHVLSLIVVATHPLRIIILFISVSQSFLDFKQQIGEAGKIIHKFYWVLDKETLIEHIKPNNELEKPRLPPTKLHTTTFVSILQMTPDPNAEIDIVGNVLCYGPSKYAGHTQNMCREVTIVDDQRSQFLLTLWDDIREIEGVELEARMEKGKEFPIILERNIRICGY
ncbi:hypothetical protein H5410_060748, partial [Solanum commersonii]